MGEAKKDLVTENLKASPNNMIRNEWKLSGVEAGDDADEEKDSCARKGPVLTKDDLQAIDEAHEDLRQGRTIGLVQAKKK